MNEIISAGGFYCPDYGSIGNLPIFIFRTGTYEPDGGCTCSLLSQPDAGVPVCGGWRPTDLRAETVPAFLWRRYVLIAIKVWRWFFPVLQEKNNARLQLSAVGNSVGLGCRRYTATLINYLLGRYGTW